MCDFSCQHFLNLFEWHSQSLDFWVLKLVFPIWFKAHICDGEDEKSKELASALENVNVTNDKDKKAKCMKIRSSVENIVHALLRVNTMNRRLPEIFSPPENAENENENADSGAVPELGNNLRLRNL